jgi:hypothetical protein
MLKIFVSYENFIEFYEGFVLWVKSRTFLLCIDYLVMSIQSDFANTFSLISPYMGKIQAQAYHSTRQPNGELSF